MPTDYGKGAQKFNFVSPGIRLNEIDRSQIDKQPLGIGPMIIGRAQRGPGNQPVRVGSYSEFVQIFGTPSSGYRTGDAYRTSYGPPSPTYAAYAAQAWLANNSPCTFMRLVGAEHPQKDDSVLGAKAGWNTVTSTGTRAVVGQQSAAEGAGGAYGLWLIASSSHDQIHKPGSGKPQAKAHTLTGSLAAIWYVAGGSLRLQGSTRTGASTGTILTNATTGSNLSMIKSAGQDAEFVVEILDNAGTTVTDKISFNFADKSSKFIRKRFNTDPTLTNSEVTPAGQLKNYWLGETFERSVRDRIFLKPDGVSRLSGSAAGDVFGIMLPLDSAGGDWADHNYDAQPAKTPFIFSQHLGGPADYTPAACQKLFRLVSHQAGQWDMHNIKIAIEDITPSLRENNPYGTFTVTLRELTDNDTNPKIIERFSNVNLNPGSPDFIGSRIGTQFKQYDSNKQRTRTYGVYPNRSQYVRVELDPALEDGGLEPSLVPFGFQAPPTPLPFALVGQPTSDAGGTGTTFQSIKQFGAQGPGDTVAADGCFVLSNLIPHASQSTGVAGKLGDSLIGFTGSYAWPTINARSSSAADGLSNIENAYFGFFTGRTNTDNNFDNSVLDLLRPLPASVNGADGKYEADGTSTISPFYFTLDDISGSAGSLDVDPNLNNPLIWHSGSRVAGNSITAVQTGSNDTPNQNPDGHIYLLNKLKVNKFLVPMFGGSDGIDITEREPFRNSLMSANTTAKTSYVYNTIEQALNTISNVEDFEFNIATMPGITHAPLTRKLVDICEERADALAIIDLEDVYTPNTEDNSTSQTTRYGNVRDVSAKLEDRQINSSYGACYYPWVRIQDTATGAPLWAPPSIVALGTMASSEQRSELWFAPAGFNRGGLSDGAAGLPVVGVSERLTAKDRDRLYEANINPIATFPAEGIVIFGQKTLQIERSALDRINVRRLLIFVKKAVSRFAAKVLFDQNVQVTWNRFLGLVNPFLKSVQTRLGLADYRVILDETTTTPDLVDRNIMYAKIYLKPARAIEFIVVDFVITNTGASFDD